MLLLVLSQAPWAQQERTGTGYLTARLVLFFDILYKGELYLDDEGIEFTSFEQAHDYLANTVREFLRLGGDPYAFDGSQTVVDITDRMHRRRTLRMADVMSELAGPLHKAA